jgi:hypothetical protein
MQGERRTPCTSLVAQRGWVDPLPLLLLPPVVVPALPLEPLLMPPLAPLPLVPVDPLPLVAPVPVLPL